MIFTAKLPETVERARIPDKKKHKLQAVILSAVLFSKGIHARSYLLKFNETAPRSQVYVFLPHYCINHQK